MRKDIGIFRGKEFDTSKWVIGYLDAAAPPDYAYIITGDEKTCRVDPETVGEWTTRFDKKVERIFEGDIIKYETPSCSVKYGVINFGKYAIHADGSTYNIGFYISWLNNPFVRQDLGFWLEQREIVIIGNIYDNPELLKGNKKK